MNLNFGEKGMLDIVRTVYERGEKVSDRTGVGTRKLFGAQCHFDLTDGRIPLFVTKKTAFNLVLSELLWFIAGNKHIDELHADNNHIWDEWVGEDGTFGPIYGSQWRSWLVHPQSGAESDGIEEIDQLAEAIHGIKTNPYGRRHIVSAWRPDEIESMALPPCHMMFQFNVMPGKDGEPKYLDCQMYQRSADLFLGVPFNVASYSILTHMVAKLTGLKARKFVWTAGDLHLYDNQTFQTEEWLSRSYYLDKAKPVYLEIDGEQETIDDFEMKDFKVVGYDPLAQIKAPVAV